MRVNDRHLSFYYEADDDMGKIEIDPAKTALLIIDMQNKFALTGMGEGLGPKERKEWERWQPFYQRIKQVVIPNNQKVLSFFREKKLEVTFARIACQTTNGRERSLDHKSSGFNQLLLPMGSKEAEIVEELTPAPDEIVVNKTTDSTLTGTNYRLLLQNMGIDTVIVAGLYTDQCISCTVRSLADESFKVFLLEDCCIAATEELHENELKILNNIYCHVINTQELFEALENA
jgi:biuret amidohydrolase